MFRILLISFTSILFGCTIQGYSGPLLPPNQTAIVRISDSRIQIDGIKTFFGGSVSVLPGSHHAEAEWTKYKDYCLSDSWGSATRCIPRTANIVHTCREYFKAVSGHIYKVDIINDNQIDIFDSTSGVHNYSSYCGVTSDEIMN